MLAAATPEQAAEIFQSIDIAEISDTEAALLVAAVQQATPKVRAAFEDKIDVYSGKLDNYIPLGSVVNVRVRRMLVVSTAFMVAMPPIPASRRI